MLESDIPPAALASVQGSSLGASDRAESDTQPSHGPHCLFYFRRSPCLFSTCSPHGLSKSQENIHQQDAIDHTLTASGRHHRYSLYVQYSKTS